jgi:hypothetical protein
MGIIKLFTAPVRSIVRFPLFQLAVVVAVILFLQAGDDKSARDQIFNGLDELVESTVGLFSAAFNVKSFTKSWLTTSFWIAYVYLACLLILALLRVPAKTFSLSEKDYPWIDSKLTQQQNGPAMQAVKLTGKREAIAKKTYIRASKISAGRLPQDASRVQSEWRLADHRQRQYRR